MIRFLTLSLSALLLLGLLGAGAVLFVFYEYGRGLPDYRQLADYEPPITTRFYAGDGALLAEYARERRVFVPIEAIPEHVKQAFLSAEDQRFYEHPGLDFIGLLRAVVTNVKNYGSGRRPVGASSITQQVAKNFLLTNEVSIERKIKEAILAFRIERAFSKDHILELYLNEIYLGSRSYGVAAAAITYFNKPLDQLSLAEAAFLAALPKAPNNYHPVHDAEAAKARRDWVLGRMADDGAITDSQARMAQAQPLRPNFRGAEEYVAGGAYFAEEVRRALVGRYGNDALYNGGLAVRTSLDPELQAKAMRALQEGLSAYDRRRGWRGPLARWGAQDDWPLRLRDADIPGIADAGWQVAVVLDVGAKAAGIALDGVTRGVIPLEELTWARKALKDNDRGPTVTAASDVLEAGDVIAVELLDEASGTYALRQVPAVDGALVALDPHTGRVLAMAGGFSFKRSQFNRATQAQRQPGSAFKPFVYLTALEQGYTPATLILDAPFVVDQGPGLPKWKPQNYSNEFYGPTTLRMGVEKSRNLMTVRLAQAVGLDRVAEVADRFGIMADAPQVLSMSLGALETTVLQLTAAYGMLVNGGKAITPSLIDRIQDRQGLTIFRHDMRPCPDCIAMQWRGQPVPALPDDRSQLTSPVHAYQMTHILEGVVKYGTGRRVRAVGKPIAGKTGTSNDSVDTWFVGFSPDLAVGVFVGFDEPRPLGRRETGSSVAAPIFTAFMTEALADQPATPFRVPPGVRLTHVDHKTGKPVSPDAPGAILEAFAAGDQPQQQAGAVIGAGGGAMDSGPAVGAGGLY